MCGGCGYVASECMMCHGSGVIHEVDDEDENRADPQRPDRWDEG